MRVYRALLVLYPRGFRRAYAEPSSDHSESHVGDRT